MEKQAYGCLKCDRFPHLTSLILFLARMKGAATLHGNAEVIDEPSLRLCWTP